MTMAIPRQVKDWANSKNCDIGVTEKVNLKYGTRMMNPRWTCVTRYRKQLIL